MLPVFTDLKIAEDPRLPGLTSSNLPLSTTAIFCGWLVGSIGLKRGMEILRAEQIIVVANMGLLLVTVAMITLPYLTAGNLLLFIAIRFFYGILMNTKPVQLMYVQDNVPPARSNQVLILQFSIYGSIAVLMAGSCGLLTLSMHWTLEVALWCGLSRCVGLWVAFPHALEILRSVPERLLAQRPSSPRKRAEENVLTPATRFHAILVTVCFLACGSSFFGLTYSAGQLSPNIYISSALLYSMDIIGYLGACGSSVIRKKWIQSGSFLTASVCLLLCSTGEPGSRFVLVFAVIGRLGIDLCYTTCYLVLAETFLEHERVRVLPLCETAARVGGTLAPFTGTLPSAISCLIFASICFAAACASINLP
eukprot:Skav230276  [mRNA]  locus=scaffold3387:568720:569814:- [translate_table: standard]